MKRFGLFAALVLLLAPGAALAHHSFAVFFQSDKEITIKGVVTDFQFSNPHGVVTLRTTEAGREAVWKAETNAPVILRRLGWTRDSLKPGDQVTIEGWPARDGSNYMRLRRVTRPDGSVVGAPLGGPGAQQ